MFCLHMYFSLLFLAYIVAALQLCGIDSDNLFFLRKTTYFRTHSQVGLKVDAIELSLCFVLFQVLLQKFNMITNQVRFFGPLTHTFDLSEAFLWYPSLPAGSSHFMGVKGNRRGWPTQAPQLFLPIN